MRNKSKDVVGVFLIGLAVLFMLPAIYFLVSYALGIGSIVTVQNAQGSAGLFIIGFFVGMGGTFLKSDM